MTHTEILEKAVARATRRGWEFDNLDKWQWSAIRKTDTVMNNWYYFLIVYDGKEKFIDAERIIYDHNFAKALWGEQTDTLTVQNNSLNVTQVIDMNGWRYHLQQMVVTPDPIAYLGQHL